MQIKTNSQQFRKARIKKYINFRSTFTKLVLSYIILSIIMIFISTIILYINYKNNVSKELSSLSEKLLIQQDKYSYNFFNWTYSYLGQLYTDPDIFKLMYNENITESEENQVKIKLNSASANIPFVHSIYIYNGKTKKFYSTISTPTALIDFYDTDVIGILKNRVKYSKIKFIPRKILFSTDTGLTYKANILTVIISQPPVEDSLENGALILNLDAKEVINTYDSISKSSTRFFAINNSGTVILDANPKNFLANLSNDKIIKDILESKEKSGYVIETVDGKKSLITYINSEYLDFKFISIIPYNNILYSFYNLKYLFIILITILLVVGVAFAVYSSKFIYSPINKLISNFKDNKIYTASEEDEISCISGAINKILSEEVSLNRLSIEDNYFIKQNLLKAIMNSDVSDINKLKNKLYELNIKIDYNDLIVFIISIDNYNKVCEMFNNKDINIFRYAICNISYELTSALYNCECVDIGNNHISVIVNIKNHALSEVNSSVLSIIEDIQQYVERYFKITVSAGIGTYVKNIEDLNRSYKSAQYYLKYRFIYGSKSILNYDKVTNDNTKNYNYPNELEKLLFDSIKSKNINDASKFLEKVFNFISIYSYSDIKIALTQLCVNSQKLIDSLINFDDENIFLDVDYFRNNINNFESIGEVKEWLLESYKKCILQINENKLSKKAKIVELVIEYIRKNYENPELSSEVLADYVKISSSYLRAIFKETTNKSLASYITEYRFEMAKYFLETTPYTINEICNKIGFSNSNYFYTSFKKFFGISPNQYRNNFVNNTK